jgi:hypothetical protein
MSRDVFDQDGDPSDPRTGKDGLSKKSGVMFLAKPAANSLSLAIRARRICDPAFVQETEFIEIETEGESVAPPLHESDKLAQARSGLARMYILYESIAESLVSETPDIYARFCAICDSEGLPRLSVADYKL